MCPLPHYLVRLSVCKLWYCNFVLGPCNEVYYGGDEKFVGVIMLVGRASNVVVYEAYVI